MKGGKWNGNRESRRGIQSMEAPSAEAQTSNSLHLPITGTLHVYFDTWVEFDLCFRSILHHACALASQATAILFSRQPLWEAWRIHSLPRSPCFATLCFATLCCGNFAVTSFALLLSQRLRSAVLCCARAPLCGARARDAVLGLGML